MIKKWNHLQSSRTIFNQKLCQNASKMRENSLPLKIKSIPKYSVIYRNILKMTKFEGLSILGALTLFFRFISFYLPMQDGPVKVLKSDLNERKIKNVRI